MELRQIKTPQDIELVKSFFYQIFFEEVGYDLSCYMDSIRGNHQYQRLEYYLGYENGEVVGISGIYADTPDECWLGWFGIRPEYRRAGYGGAILDLSINMMQHYGYKICRLYTDIVTNKKAVQLYMKKGFKQDSVCQQTTITMSKSLDGISDVPAWQGKPLGFISEGTL